MFRHLSTLGLAVLLSMGACLVQAATDDARLQAASVTAQPLGKLVVHAEREAPASALSLNESRLSAEVAAVVQAIPVQVGELVEPGAVLVRLDPRDHELALKRASAALQSVQARIKLAEFQLNRAQELYKKNFASEDTLTQRKTELSVLRSELAGAQAQVDSARRDLAKCTVTAPFRAIVHERSAHVGELAAPGTPLLTLIDVSRIEVSAQVQPKDGPLLEAAEAVSFAAPSRNYPVRLLRLSPAIDRNARTREARLAFVGDSAPPGTEGRIVWQAAQPLLPADLVSRREGRLGVFIADHGTARFVVLDQAQEGRPVAIGLPLETSIILEGRFGLQDGQPITLSP